MFLEQLKKHCPLANRSRLLKRDRECILTSLVGKISARWFKRLKADEGTLKDLARGVEKQVAIMFADLRDFTRTTAEMPPERIVAMLDAFLPEMLHIIIEKRLGMVDKILGDGILAVFGHPYGGDDDLDAGLRAAADMQAAMAEMGPIFERLGMPRMQLGIGMNFGSVLVCHIGSKQHSENTIIGQPVNLAAKMEDIAPAREVVLAAPGVEYLQKRDSALARLLEPVGPSKYGEGHARFRWDKIG